MPFAKDTYILVLSFDKEYLIAMKPLRVGIDLTAIWRRPTGIFRYAAEVAKHLLLLQETEPPIRYVFFFAHEIHPEFLPFQDSFYPITCPPKIELLLKHFCPPMLFPRL